MFQLGRRIPYITQLNRVLTTSDESLLFLWVTYSYRTTPSRSLVMDTLRQVHLKSGHTNETCHPKGDFQQWHPPTWINGIIISAVPMSLKFFKHISYIYTMIYYLEVITYNLLKFRWRWRFFHIPNKIWWWCRDVDHDAMITCTDQQKQSSSQTWLEHNIPQWHQCTHPSQIGDHEGPITSLSPPPKKNLHKQHIIFQFPISQPAQGPERGC